MKHHSGFQVMGLDCRFSIVFSLSKVYPTFNGALRSLNRLVRSSSDPHFYFRINLVDL